MAKKLKIRPATLEEVEELEQLVYKFFDIACFEDKGLTYSSKTVLGVLEKLIKGSGVVIVALEKGSGIPLGLLAGMVHQSIMNEDQMIFSELMWFVEPAYRGVDRVGLRLLKEAEKEAKKKGAAISIMVTLDSKRENNLKKVYEALKYKHLEHHFLKEI